MTRIAPVPPSHCSACFAQYPDRRHVDMESSWDGPVIEGGVVGEDGIVQDTIKVSIDELILCENCVRDAAALIGMEPVDMKERDRLLEVNGELARKVMELEKHNASLQAALLTKPEAPAPPARKKQPVKA